MTADEVIISTLMDLLVACVNKTLNGHNLIWIVREKKICVKEIFSIRYTTKRTMKLLSICPAKKSIY